MRGLRTRSGFVLPTTMIFLLIVGIVIASVMGFVSHGTRMARIALAKDRCRLAAQCAIEEAKARIQSRFTKYLGTTGTAVRIDPKQAEAYNWFDKVSADHRTIGVSDAKNQPVTLTDPPGGINGCEVHVGIGAYVDHPRDSPVAAVPIVATAVYTYPDGLRVSATIQESVCFATGQSQVFNYAYFVNNYGWMNGSTIYINGDMRANGNVSLSGSTVNGFVYGAVNDEVGADGSIALKNSPKIKNRTDYRSSSQTTTSRARPDMGTYDTLGSYDAPAVSGTITLPRYDANGLPVPGTGTVGMKSGDPIANPKADPIPMPFVSYLDDYVEYAREKGGTLTCPAYSYKDGTGATRTVPATRVSAHFNGAGPSGNAALADKGALVLIGTQSNPIVVNGPVVVDSDVIIKGYVRGQGTIYSGRNVHIIGDIKYLNAPNWTHDNASESANLAREESNATKDMLGLVAKGNIVVGDPSSSSWYNSVSSYINGGSSSVVERYACDESDANIGYPAVFQGNYTAKEYVAGGGVNRTGYFPKVRTGTESYLTTEQYWDSRTRSYKTRQVTATRAVLKDTVDRRYYETVCDDSIFTLKDSRVACIDAILYNNHGIFGTPGGSGVRFNLNGSLVCRDEALIFSGDGINFNWDMRLMPKNGNKVTGALALPVGPQKPYTVVWQEIPDRLNPVLGKGGVRP